jgi:hypothetical protein
MGWDGRLPVDEVEVIELMPGWFALEALAQGHW